MKRKTLNRILGIMVIAAIVFAACTKETSNVRLPATMSTSQTLNIKSDAATVVGFVVA